jgi:hypothetical protein
MTRGLAFAVIAGALATGCLFDKQIDRPARFYAGPNMRAINPPVAGEGDAASTARSTAAPPASSDRLSAVSASLQFTMAMAHHMYAGGEVETGRLETPGSNLAGGYAIIGGEHATRLGSLGVELAAGWRGLRYDSDDENDNRLILEPRVRGQLWFANQFTLGGAVGARLGSEGEWMAGVYLGVHSHAF